MLKDIPFKIIVKLIRSLRHDFFTVPWPDHAPSIYCDKDLESVLRDEHHFEGTYLGYNYKGEVLNLRAPWGTNSDGKQMELHVRARPAKRDDYAYEYVAHLEKSRFEHPEEHVNEIGFSWETGTMLFTDLLEQSDINYTNE